MNHSKTCQVEKLPTEYKTNIFISDYGTVLNFSNISTYYHGGQYLYILSDDEIKAGDFYFMLDWGIMECRDDEEAERCNKHWAISRNCAKIIASSDITIEVPRIPKKFLKEYCEKGGIDKVEVDLSNAENLIKTL